MRPSTKLFNLLSVLGIVLILAGSLDNLELLPGEISVSHNESRVAEPLASSTVQEEVSDFDPPFWILYLFLIPVFYIVFKLLTKLTWDPIQDKDWRKYLALIVIITLTIFLLSLLIGFSGNTATDFLQSSGFRVPKLIEASLLKNRIPLWVGFTAVLVLASLGVIQLLKHLIHEKSQSGLSELRELVDREISKTTGRISSGEDARETIIHCYQNMCILLNQYVRQERAESSTPKEFADQLEQIGFRGPHIVLLTQLFEKARYSETIFSPDETRQAVACLNEVSLQSKEENVD